MRFNHFLVILAIFLLVSTVTVIALSSIYDNQKNEVGKIFRLRIGESTVINSEDMKIRLVLTEIYHRIPPEDPEDTCLHDCRARFNISLYNKKTGNTREYRLGVGPNDSAFIIEVLNARGNKALLLVPNDLHYLTDPLDPSEDPEVTIIPEMKDRPIII